MFLVLIFSEQSGQKPDDIRVQELRTLGEGLLSPFLEAAKREGIEVRGEVRVGEPASEMLKFLAEDHVLHSVVWGGDNSVLDTKRLRHEDHWLDRIKDKFGCPLVSPKGPDAQERKEGISIEPIA